MVLSFENVLSLAGAVVARFRRILRELSAQGVAPANAYCERSATARGTGREFCERGA